ncbi:MAG: RNA polymerase sigma factor RpoE [Stenotrophomonas sp.]
MADQQMPQEPDHSLVGRVQAGERAAFDVLVRRHQHRVLAVIGRYIADWSECQDVAQEAFVRAFRAIDSFRGDAQFSTWMHRIAVNTAKNHLTAQNRRPPAADIDLIDAEVVNDSARLRDTDTPERELMREQVERCVLAAVAQLPADWRQAFELREVQGLSYEQIAQSMNCPVGTVRSRIYRAREAIDHHLRPLLEGRSATRERSRA